MRRSSPGGFPLPLLLLVLALAPVVVLLRTLDRYDVFPEPRRVVFTTFALGVASSLISLGLAIGIMGSFEAFESRVLRILFINYVLAATCEEFAKFLVLRYYCARHTAFDEPMDGLVYGSTAALGFAAAENVLYVFTAEHGVAVALLRALFSVPGHAAWGAIMGYNFARIHFDPQRKRKYYASALIVPILLHGTYNAWIDFGQMIEDVSLFFLAFTGWLVFVSVSFSYAIRIRDRLFVDQLRVRDGD